MNTYNHVKIEKFSGLYQLQVCKDSQALHMKTEDSSKDMSIPFKDIVGVHALKNLFKLGKWDKRFFMAIAIGGAILLPMAMSKGSVNIEISGGSILFLLFAIAIAWAGFYFYQSNRHKLHLRVRLPEDERRVGSFLLSFESEAERDMFFKEIEKHIDISEALKSYVEQNFIPSGNNPIFQLKRYFKKGGADYQTKP